MTDITKAPIKVNELGLPAIKCLIDIAKKKIVKNKKIFHIVSNIDRPNKYSCFDLGALNIIYKFYSLFRKLKLIRNRNFIYFYHVHQHIKTLFLIVL